MTHFTVTTEGKNRLDLRGLCERFANDLWVPTHLSPEQGAAFVLDYFKRTVRAELEMLEVEYNELEECGHGDPT